MEKFLKHQKHISSPNASLARTAGSRKIVLTKDGDKEFHARVLSSLREWLDTPIEGAQDAEGVSFLLPRCNSFLRRSLYEAINEDYPYLVLETQQEQIRVWRLTTEERERRNQRLLVEGYKKLIENKIGAQKIFLALSKACSGEPILNQTEHIVLAPNASEAMTEFSPKCISNRKIPLVVHNGLMDLLFLMTHFHSPVLPNEWTECKRLVHSHFPIIYDTKILASDYCFRNNILENRRRTRLEDIYEKTLVDYPQWKKQNSHDDHAHDAAYDAYMSKYFQKRKFTDINISYDSSLISIGLDSHIQFSVYVPRTHFRYPKLELVFVDFLILFRIKTKSRQWIQLPASNYGITASMNVHFLGSCTGGTNFTFIYLHTQLISNHLRLIHLEEVCRTNRLSVWLTSTHQ